MMTWVGLELIPLKVEVNGLVVKPLFLLDIMLTKSSVII